MAPEEGTLQFMSYALSFLIWACLNFYNAVSLWLVMSIIDVIRGARVRVLFIFGIDDFCRSYRSRSFRVLNVKAFLPYLGAVCFPIFQYENFV